ncbi:UNVERIFIED_CONTAM: hypothetical protein LK11_06845 [Mumia flava]
MWCAWLATSGLVGLAAAGPVLAVIALGGCAAALGADEVVYRRRARRWFAEAHRRAQQRHDAVLDAWLARRDGDPDRQSTRLVDDVRSPGTARFVERATRAADLRGLARPDAYEAVLRYDEAVAELERAWRRLEARARLADAPQEAQAWMTERVVPWLGSSRSAFATFVRAAREHVRERG